MINEPDVVPAGDEERAVLTVFSRCTGCLRCVTECGFLKKHGAPGRIAMKALESADGVGAIPFECSFCRLCDAVCPENISPADMFLALRRAHIARNTSILRRYSSLLRYEKLGSSRLLSLYAIPQDCDTVFFPGCNLPGARPEATERIFRALSAHIPNLGIVMDCCNRPSYSLGRSDFFHDEFGRKMKRLMASGVKTIITACPGCHDVFLRHGAGVRVVSVYEVMAAHGPGLPRLSMELAVHDPCALRFNDAVSGAVRKLLADADVTIFEMKHSRRMAFCCGEGGAVERADAELSDGWREKVFREAEGRRVLTSCGGCQYRLSRRMEAIHLLDLFRDQAVHAGDDRASRPPMTYLNRFLFRLRIGRIMKGEP